MFVRVPLFKDTWTLVAQDVAFANFANSGQFPIYVDATSSPTVEPSSDYGMLYQTGESVHMVPVANLTINGGDCIWAKAQANDKSSIIIELPNP